MPHFSPGFTHMFAGLPVHDFHEPLASAYHCISSSAVFTSGAAIYSLGETAFSATANACTIFFFSSLLRFFGSAMIPDFAPPNGNPAKEHFQVMVRARRKTSSTVTDGVILMPPLPGPSAVLSITST